MCEAHNAIESDEEPNERVLAYHCFLDRAETPMLALEQFFIIPVLIWVTGTASVAAPMYDKS